MKRIYYIFILLILAQLLSASQTKIRQMVYLDLKIQSFDKKNGLLSLQLKITPDTETTALITKTIPEICKEIPLDIITSEELIIQTDKSMILNFDDNNHIYKTVDIKIPNDKVSKISFKFTCTTTDKQLIERFYINPMNDSVVVSRLNNQIKTEDNNSHNVSSKLFRDTLTKEQLDHKYQVAFELTKKDHYDFIKQYVDSLIPHSKEGVYIGVLSLRSLYQIIDNPISKDFEMDWVTRPWETKSPSITSQKKNDKSITTGLGYLYLDNINGSPITSKLPINQQITFNIGIENYSGINIDGIANGFRVYSPDNATWSSITADTLGSLQWGSIFDLIFSINYFSNNGSGADTVGFGGSRLFSTGLPSSFNDTAYSITIGTFDQNDLDKTVCLDSSYYPPTGTWIWAPSSASNDYPEWGGPYCFTIGQEDSITISGYFYYQDPEPPGNYNTPMKNVSIEMWDADVGFDDRLDSTSTNEFGHFTLGPIDNTNDIYGTQDVYLKIYANNNACYVTESYNGDIHSYQTPEHSDMASGNYNDTSFHTPLSNSGPFFIAEEINFARESWNSISSGNLLPKLQVRNEDKDSISHYNDTHTYIHIEAGDLNTWYPHTFQSNIIYHEYGHYIQYYHNFFDSSGGDHEWLVYSSSNLAASEGFATFFANVIQNNQLYQAYDNTFSDSYWIDAENGETNTHPSYSVFSVNNAGDGYEAVITGILWDIYDNINDDYSTYGVIGDPNDSLSDGVGDTLSLGLSNILTVLLERTIDGHHPDNITEFWDAWFQEPSLGHDKAMRDIWYEHGIQKSCCEGATGNVDGDPLDLVDIADIVYFVYYAFASGPEPPCLPEANLDGDSSVDIADLVYFIEYSFGNPTGPAPVSCTFVK